MLPSVSCLCLTYGRFELLEEAVESFLRQDYPGDMELIVLNDHEHQQILFDHPKVRVINLITRCPSLGFKRNVAAAHATKELLVTWGDDDIHLPWRISRLVRAYQQAQTAAVLDGKHYILFRGVVDLKKHSTMGSILVTNTAYHEVGGVPEINSGEDIVFVDRLRARWHVPECQEEPPGFFYRWDSPRRHISQFGKDVPGSTTAWGRYAIVIQRLMDLGVEPTGKLRLAPQWRRDYIRSTQTGSLVNW